MSGGWLGLDIGGANLKAADDQGAVRSRPFAVWRRPEALGAQIRELVAPWPRTRRVALTMTAELCDCFETKAEGVRAVLSAVAAALPKAELAVWGTDGRFHDPAAIACAPGLAAASNWLALATRAARLVPSGPALLIDVGTTTTDLIPLRDGRPAPRGRTDTRRLQTGELVYAGTRRTPLMAVASELPYRGAPTGLVAELFATTIDVYLTLGAIDPDPDDRATADGRPATVAYARDRLARMIGADRETFTDQDALVLARAADTRLMDRLVAAAELACGAVIGRPTAVVVSGSGVFLALRLAERILGPDGSIARLDHVWGPPGSEAACAVAVARLAADGFGGMGHG